MSCTNFGWDAGKKKNLKIVNVRECPTKIGTVGNLG